MPQETKLNAPTPSEPMGNALAGNANIKLKPSQNDARVLRDLCGTLNNPAITGAQIPPEEKAAIDALVASPVPTQKTESISTAPVAAPALTPERPIPALATKQALVKVFLTGRAGGADEIARQTG